MSEQSSEPAARPRLRAWVVAAGYGLMLIPFVLLVGWMARGRIEYDGFGQVARIHLEGGLSRASVGSDRIGDHLVALSSDQHLHALTHTGDGWYDQRMPIPWKPDQRGRSILQLADSDSDGLVDVNVVQLPRMLSAQTADVPGEVFLTAVYLQHRSPGSSGANDFQLKLSHVGMQPPLRRSRSFYSDVQAGGIHYTARSTRASDGLVATALDDARTGRAAQLVSGQMLFAADFDGDGNQDLVTYRPAANDGPPYTVRVFLYRHGSFVSAFRRTLTDAQPVPASFLVLGAGDLLDTGLPQLVCLDRDHGDINLWAFDPAKMPR